MNASVVIELPQDINRLCRTCMKVVEGDEDSFEHKIVSNHHLTDLCKVLESVTSLKISVGDGLPETLCSQCNEYLNVASLFKNHCHRVDKDLRELVLMTDTKESLNPAVDTKEAKIPSTETDKVFICHICLNTCKSNYELSMHLLDHNKGKTLSEQFKDYQSETKPAIGYIDNNVVDLIIERKLYTFVGQKNIPKIPYKNGYVDSLADSDSVTSKVGLDTNETPECDFCGISFHSKDELDSHNCEDHKDQNDQTEEIDTTTEFMCPLCPKILGDSVALSIHFLKHAFTLDVSAEPSFCEKCGQLFDDKILLAQHYDQNLCTKEVWACLICNAEFETETLLLIHNNCHETKLSNQSTFKCILCDESFTSKENLESHSLTHLMKKYLCKECSVSFCTQSSYFQHLKTHPGYQYTCIICGQLSKTKYALKCHIFRVHSEKPTYTCNICNKSFKTLSYLKTHSHIHNTHKKYMCSYCGYTSHKSGDLQIHIRSHTSERPYKCTFPNCSMKFKTSSHLCTHIRRHLNIRNFTCLVCKTSFGTSHSLKVHQMLHTGEKPHKCGVCGNKFRRKYHLNVHMKQHLSISD